MVIFEKEYSARCLGLRQLNGNVLMLSVIAVKRNCSLCELLGMNANVPTDICFSFAGLIGAAVPPVHIETDGASHCTKEKAAARSTTRSQALILKLHDSFGNIRSRAGSSSAI